MIKKLLGIFLTVVASLSFAGPLDLTIQQRNAQDIGNITRTLTSPSTDGIIYYNVSTQLPGYLTFGAGLSVSNGVLSAAALPNLSTVAYTGQYADLVGAPTQAVFNFGDPVTRTLAVSTAYQAADPTKASILSITSACTASLSLTAGSTCTMQIRTSPTSGLTCSNGTVYGTVTNVNTGTLTIGLGLNQRVGSLSTVHLRNGGYFILCPTAGTFDISAVDQTAG